MTTLLLKNAQLSDGRMLDIALDKEQIVAMAQKLDCAADQSIDLQGLATGPAFCDHHIHLRATAAKANSWLCDGNVISSPTEFERTLTQQGVDSQGWIRGLGFHELHCGDLDGDALDAIRSDVPIRVQHVSGRLWLLNKAARALLGQGPWDERGRLWDQDAWLGERLRKLYADKPPSLTTLSQRLASLGVVAVTDTSPANDETALEQFSAEQNCGDLRQRMLMMGQVSLNPHYANQAAGTDVRIGPYKIHLLESELPDLDQLGEDIGVAHSYGRPVAFHCVSRAELVFALAALQQAGRIDGDRIEHAGVCPDELVPMLRGLIVVTQPIFVHDRGDRYLAEVAAEDQPYLYRLAALKQAGIALAGSSDAPYGDVNPWTGIHAAMHRKSGNGAVIGAAEKLAFVDAYQLWTGDLASPHRARTLALGGLADIAVWDRSWADIQLEPKCTKSVLTLSAGRIIWRSTP